MVVGSYVTRPDNGEIELMPSHHWVKGTHAHRDGITNISYNVAVEVDLSTIIEEELHAQIEDLHHTDTVETIEHRIREENPDLAIEIEQNLNKILSTEEKKFYDMGDTLREECSSELRVLDKFIEKFECETIENSRTNYYLLAVAQQQRLREQSRPS